eukprot:gene11054-18660_t
MVEILLVADRCGGNSFDREANGQAKGFLEDGIWVFPVNIDNMDSPRGGPPAVTGRSAHLSPFSSFIPAPVSSNSAHLAPVSSFTPTHVIPDNFEMSAVPLSTPIVHLEINPFPPPSVQPGYSATSEPIYQTSNPAVPTERDRLKRGVEAGGLNRTSHRASSPLQHLDHAICARTTKNKWLWTGSVIVSDMGTFMFKGLSDEQQIFSIMTSSTRGKPCTPKLADAGNVIVADACNVIVADAGNVIVADAGNVIVADAGNVIVADAGNVIVADAGNVQNHRASHMRETLLAQAPVACVIISDSSRGMPSSVMHQGMLIIIDSNRGMLIISDSTMCQCSSSDRPGAMLHSSG